MTTQAIRGQGSDQLTPSLHGHTDTGLPTSAEHRKLPRNCLPRPTRNKLSVTEPRSAPRGVWAPRASGDWKWGPSADDSTHTSAGPGVKERVFPHSIHCSWETQSGITRTWDLHLITGEHDGKQPACNTEDFFHLWSSICPILEGKSLGLAELSAREEGLDGPELLPRLPVMGEGPSHGQTASTEGSAGYAGGRRRVCVGGGRVMET